MVLSNKKLKAKLRASLQQSAENGGAASLQCGSNPMEVQELLSAASKGRSTLSKREKRRQMRQAPSDMSEKGVCGAGEKGTAMENEQDEAIVNNNKKKKEKRKREENEATQVENKPTQMESKGTPIEHEQVDATKDNKKKGKKKKRSASTEDERVDAIKDNEKKEKKKRSAPIEDEQADATKDNEKKKTRGNPIDGEQLDATKDNEKKEKKKKRSATIEEEQADATKDSEEEEEEKKKRSTPIEDEQVDAIKDNKKKEKKKKRRKSVEGMVDGITPTPEAAEIVINVTSTQQSSVPESQESEYDTLKVYVGGIPYYSKEDDIRSFFEGCGTVTEVDCMKFPDSGKFRGIALVSFKTEAAAKRALALDGADMGGRYLKIQQFRSSRNLKNNKQVDFKPCKIDNTNRAYIGNLAWNITEDDLKNLFIDCNISSIRFGMDKITGQFKGYGHIDFADDMSLAMAVKLDQEVVCGRPIKISYAVPKKDAKPEGNSKIKSSGENRKRRTCYICGVPGHLSSSCSQNQSAELVGSKGGS